MTVASLQRARRAVADAGARGPTATSTDEVDRELVEQRRLAGRWLSLLVLDSTLF